MEQGTKASSKETHAGLKRVHVRKAFLQSVLILWQALAEIRKVPTELKKKNHRGVIRRGSSGPTFLTLALTDQKQCEFVWIKMK